MLELYSLLCIIICILTVSVTPYSSDIPFIGAYTTSYAQLSPLGILKMTTKL